MNEWKVIYGVKWNERGKGRSGQPCVPSGRGEEGVRGRWSALRAAPVQHDVLGSYAFSEPPAREGNLEERQFSCSHGKCNLHMRTRRKRRRRKKRGRKGRRRKKREEMRKWKRKRIGRINNK